MRVPCWQFPPVEVELATDVVAVEVELPTLVVVGPVVVAVVALVDACVLVVALVEPFAPVDDAGPWLAPPSPPYAPPLPLPSTLEPVATHATPHIIQPPSKSLRR